MSLALRISGVSKTYPNGVRALDHVDLTVPTGLFGLLGPNGAGKSTLMRTVATLQEPDEGTVTFDGLDVLRQKDELRRRLGYLPQDFDVYPRVTAAALLNHLAVLKGIVSRRKRQAAVEMLLHKTNLWEVRKRRLGTFSGGMKRRFGIAQALLGDPELIIVDEPTAGLDPEERRRFLNLLAALGETIVVVLSTHIVDDVSDLCQRMAVLSKGKVLRTGRPRDAIRELEGHVWGAEVTQDELPGLVDRMNVVSTTLSGGRTVVHVLADRDPGDGFEPVEPNLEHVYFATLAAVERPVAA